MIEFAGYIIKTEAIMAIGPVIYKGPRSSFVEGTAELTVLFDNNTITKVYNAKEKPLAEDDRKWLIFQVFSYTIPAVAPKNGASID